MIKVRGSSFNALSSSTFYLILRNLNKLKGSRYCDKLPLNQLVLNLKLLPNEMEIFYFSMARRFSPRDARIFMAGLWHYITVYSLESLKFARNNAISRRGCADEFERKFHAIRSTPQGVPLTRIYRSECNSCQLPVGGKFQW